MSALTRFFAGAIHGRTHRSAPTQCRKRSGTNGKWSGTVPLRGGTKPAYRCTTGRAQRTGQCGHRPLRRRSRLAARRMAEAREETGERHAGSSCPTGESPGRDAPSWFPALAPERIEIIFRRGVYVAKNTSQAASVENGRPIGAAILCAQSACAFIRPRQLCCLGRGNLSLKCSSVHFSDLKYP